MRVYLSGPIKDKENYEQAFAEAEKILKESGYEVINPVSEGKHLKLVLGREPTYEEYMKHDLQVLLQADGISMLNGWKYSAGATVEHDVAKVTGKTFVAIRYVGEIKGWRK